MNLVVAIGGLALLILIHEAGHFVVARAVAMRPRKFYLFFPPALFKWHRHGIEYGIGSIPLGGYVKIPGMHRPAAGDVDAHFASTLEEAPWVRPEFNRVRRALDEQDFDEARAALPDLEAAIARSQLSEQATRSAHRGADGDRGRPLAGRLLAGAGLEADLGDPRRPGCELHLRDRRARGRLRTRGTSRRDPRGRSHHRGLTGGRRSAWRPVT